MTTREEIEDMERQEAMQERVEGCVHEYIDDVMPENGVDYPIRKCIRCGDWR